MYNGDFADTIARKKFFAATALDGFRAAGLLG
jgi:hypothetical protein